MQFTHEAQISVEAPCGDVWEDWSNVHHLPQFLSHLRGTAKGPEADLARLVIALDGRHLEFAAQRTMCESETLCWQSLGPSFLYVLTVTVSPCQGNKTSVTVMVAYDPPGFLPDIAESLGRSKVFRAALEDDLRRYARANSPLGKQAELASAG